MTHSNDYTVQVYSENGSLLIEYPHRALRAAKRRLSTLIRASAGYPKSKLAAWVNTPIDGISASPASWAKMGKVFVIRHPDGLLRTLRGLLFQGTGRLSNTRLY